MIMLNMKQGSHVVLSFVLLGFGGVVQGVTCPPGSGTINVAGSSTVFPVADAWSKSFMERCAGWTVSVRGGGSSAGMRQVCNQRLKDGESPVDIGDMSREWNVPDEASTPTYPWLYECADTNREAIQALVGYDGLSIAVARNSVADRCIATLPGGGLTMDQLRWIYSDLTEAELSANQWTNDLQGTSSNTVTRRTWAELAGPSTDCPDEPILISGADDDSGTQEYFRESVFSGSQESFGGHTDSTVAREGGYFNSALDEDIVQYLVANPTAIGYFGYAYVVESAGSVWPVPIYNPRVAKYVTPTFESIAAGEYEPFSRPIYMNVLNTAATLSKAGPFLAHGYSEAGDADVRSVGYIPVSLAERTIMLTRLQAEGGVDRQDIECGPAGEFTIAGSSTVFPVAELWSGIYSVFCTSIKINVFGGGSSVGACRVCGQCESKHGDPIPGPVDIGDMSRDWKDGVEATTDNGWEWDCANSGREVAQVEVAIDGLSVVTAQQGPARECIESLGGLTRDQLRWIYSDLSVSQLIASGWDPSSVPNRDGNDETHLWSELSSSCAQTEILISGADILSGTYDYMAEYLFEEDGETFDRARPRSDSVNPSYFNSALDEEVVDYVVGNEAAIGYFGYSYFVRFSDVLEAVPIYSASSNDFVEPNPSNIEGGSYPIARRIYMNVLDSPSSTINTLPFLEFGLSEAGQRLVALTGYSPIPEWENYVMHARIETDFSKDKSATEWLRDAGQSCARNGFTIAGSSTVRPVADIWAGMYEVGCDVGIEVFGGGSGAGAARVCANDDSGLGGPVEIGNMSREWKSSEAEELSSAQPREYRCLVGDTSRRVLQFQVATDGLTLAVKEGGAADRCIQTLNGLTLDQIRWMYSSLDETELEAQGDWDPSSIPNSDGNPTTHKWSELNAACADTEILISGADSISGTYEYFKEVVFRAEGETFGSRPGASYVNNAVDEILVDYLIDNEAAISYFGYTYFFSRSDVLAAVPVFNEAVGSYVSPDSSSIASGRYAPFSRPIYMNLLSNGDSLDDTASFIRFGLSRFGEKLVDQTGYVPIPTSLADQQLAQVDRAVDGVDLDDDDDGLSTGAIAGIVVGAVVVLGIVVIMLMKRGGGKRDSSKGSHETTHHHDVSENAEVA